EQAIRINPSTLDSCVRNNYSSLRCHIANVAFGHIQPDPHDNWYIIIRILVIWGDKVEGTDV
ncbi:MAG TPA: hypothetical protein VE130_16545, partial [Nitrososphaeraceae archaeon]|nr:hypothetical protein [Nitrososphaeraceae archaeon]